MESARQFTALWHVGRLGWVCFLDPNRLANMAATVLRVGMLIGIRYMGSVLFCNIQVKDRVSWAVYRTMKFGAKDEDHSAFWIPTGWLAWWPQCLKSLYWWDSGSKIYIYRQCAILQHVGRRWRQPGSLLHCDIRAEQLGESAFWIPTGWLAWWPQCLM